MPRYRVPAQSVTISRTASASVHIQVRNHK
jgi:hypothetical protein